MTDPAVDVLNLTKVFSAGLKRDYVLLL